MGRDGGASGRLSAVPDVARWGGTASRAGACASAAKAAPAGAEARSRHWNTVTDEVPSSPLLLAPPPLLPGLMLVAAAASLRRALDRFKKIDDLMYQGRVGISATSEYSKYMPEESVIEPGLASAREKHAAFCAR